MHHKKHSRTYEDGIIHGLNGAIEFLADRLGISTAIASLKTRNRYDAGLHAGGVLAIEHALNALRRDVRTAKREIAKRVVSDKHGHLRESTP